MLNHAFFFDTSTGTTRFQTDEGLKDLGKCRFDVVSRRAWLSNATLVVDGRLVFFSTRKVARAASRPARP